MWMRLCRVGAAYVLCAYEVQGEHGWLEQGLCAGAEQQLWLGARGSGAHVTGKRAN